MGKNEKRIVLMVVFGLIITLSVVTYAYYIGSTNNDKAQTANVSTGTMSLTFADNDNGFGGTIEFGQTITKKFTIQNTGTLDASAQMNWYNLTNTYLYESLVYDLEYSDSLNGTYTKLITNEKVPTSEVSITEILAPKITVPTKKTYYYNLKITLVDSETVDQTQDLNASFFTQFSLTGLNGNSAPLNTLTTLGFIPKSSEPDFNLISPPLIYKERPSTKVESQTDITDAYYVTYSDVYSFNKNTGLYTLINPKLAKYVDVYSELPGKYVVYLGEGQEDAYYEEADVYIPTDETTATTMMYTTYKRQNTNKYDYEKDGIYMMEDDYGTSYYFRGAASNNYVKFGKWASSWYKGYYNTTNTKSYHYYSSLVECQNATNYNVNCTPIDDTDMYWRIVRINGDGSIRLSYDGTKLYKRHEQDSIFERGIAYVKYNEALKNSENAVISENALIGYMYGTTGASTYDATHANANDSNAKKIVDKWYEINFKNSSYEKYISDEVFCNDRSISSGTGISDNTTYYGAYDRLWNKKTPKLACPQKHDAFTVNDTIKGNGDLTYPIGLITADEAWLSGALLNTRSLEHFLNKGVTYFTMSPYNTNTLMTMNLYEYRNNYFYNEYIISPVINLSPETAKELIGNGTMDDPFRLP